MIKNLLGEDENQISEIKSESEVKLNVPESIEEVLYVQPVEPKIDDAHPFTGDESEVEKETIFQSDFKAESPAEIIRKSGLAYAAAITLVGAVVFMLIIGWFVDLLVGSSPWGIVGGIILGSAIGFYQFFRLTSQILKNKD
jgi:ATP synthase protein I